MNTAAAEVVNAATRSSAMAFRAPEWKSNVLTADFTSSRYVSMRKHSHRITLRGNIPPERLRD